MENKSTAILLVNARQKDVLFFLEKLHAIKIVGANNLNYSLSGRSICVFAYISGPKFLTRSLYKLFAGGFLVSKNGQDRTNYNTAIDLMASYLKEKQES